MAGGGPASCGWRGLQVPARTDGSGWEHPATLRAGGGGVWAVCLGGITHSLSVWPRYLFAAACQGARRGLRAPGNISGVLSLTPSLVPTVWFMDWRFLSALHQRCQQSHAGRSGE